MTIEFITNNAQVGGDMQRSIGEILVQCFVPINTGEKQLNVMCDAARTIFQNQNFGGVSCFATSINRIGATGNWYQFNASTAFQYDVFS